ncbi:hypothetical protein FB567DRAFT_436330 [Paraphoma chrysanthemicola]|uniref:Oxidoreductase-like protein n=1 Tax=Paraphoma chrysanthemicola TaxID=798071 RepID=A0A8K0R9W6_9PLEO|nr:hypothetical protein FB567DRAFT_436330 [Paraphoma chrysanthemicola]
MSAQAIEARSLSSLTALASNPPAYPRNPTHVRHEPLVLYIARVPGSKDVFLSPMKPRDKVVTAEDITSSLYFLHVEQPEDANLVAPPEFRVPNYAGQDPAAFNRPPVPAVQRKAIPGVSAAQNPPPRKAVSGTLAPVEHFGNRQNVSAGHYAQRPEMLGPDYGLRRSNESARYQGETNLLPSPRRSPERPRPVSTSLTLIRRDPASGAQWNVARIEDPPIDEISSTSFNDPTTRRRTGAPMYIEVTNPGYSKFLHSDNAASTSSRSVEQSTTNDQRENTPQTDRPVSDSANVFRRRLWMEGSQYNNGGFGHRKNSSYDFNPVRPGSRGSYDARTDRTSTDTRTTQPPFLTRDDQTYSTIQVTDRPTSFRGYVFTSPWNGRCEFVTGSGGGSLKCRHIVPGLQGAPPAAMLVSELRFNLPSSSIPPTPKGEESSKRSSFFHRGRHSRNNSSISVNRDNTEDVRSSLDRLDLSLGQELAGGGFGGKQAKLGKIIVEDEGLKMMDLLVAANLALWWRAYEKARASSRWDRGSF